MSKHTNTAPFKALIAAGLHLRKKDGADPFEILSRKFGDLTDVTLKKIGETDAGVMEVKGQLDALEQSLARGNGGMPAPAPTWGREMIEVAGNDIKALAETNQGRVGLNVKATLTTGISSGGALEIPTRDATAGMPQQRLTVRNLLNVISISTGSVEYANQTTRPTAADMVAEGALKPESAIDWEVKTTSAKVIAHWIKASRQVMEDLPQLRDLIDSELRYGLALREEAQLLNGDGTGVNLMGMVPSATAFVDPIGPGAGDTMIDMIGKAILQTALADFPATGIVLHPADWWRMRLLKDADGRYLLGDPQAVIQPSLFGLPVVPTKSMTVDKFLVGDFTSAGTLYDRWAPRVEVAYTGDDFTRNLVTILAEERIAFAVKQGKALTYGDFGFVV